MFVVGTKKSYHRQRPKAPKPDRYETQSLQYLTVSGIAECKATLNDIMTGQNKAVLMKWRSFLSVTEALPTQLRWQLKAVKHPNAPVLT
eukprot:2915841-Amphidinium_carterae.1